MLATRLFLDGPVETPYSANACWGFDDKVGMTWFDLTKMHDLSEMVVEVDFYHSGSLMGLDDDAIVDRAKSYLDTMVPAFAGAAACFGALALLAPYTMMRDCNLEVAFAAGGPRGAGRAAMGRFCVREPRAAQSEARRHGSDARSEA